MSNNSCVLITGGAGYLGSVLTEHLLGKGHHVTVIDNFLYGQMPLNHLCYHPKLTIINGDCRDMRLIRALRFDVLIPLAAIVGAPACAANPELSHSTNIDAISDVVGLLSNEQLVVYPTTNSGYGIGESGKLCDESTPLRPISAYGKQKIIAESIVMERKNSISLRLATVFGMSPRMRLDLLVNSFVYRAMKDKYIVLFEPNFKRNYIHVRDVAMTFDHAIGNFERMRGQVYNAGLSSANLSKLELCEAIKRQWPEMHIVVSDVGSDPDKRDYIVSNAKLEATGWKPAHSLDDGIAELIRGYQQFGRGQYTNA